MDWRHIIIMVLLFAAGVYVGAKKPGLISTVTGGAVSV